MNTRPRFFFTTSNAARLLATLVLAASAAPTPAGDHPGWIELFDGKSLEGWTQRGGNAKYHAEDGAIVGTSAPRTPNSFLCTQREFGDFILELEFLVDRRMNSGIQFRSVSRQDYRNGVVHGYQFEIDPSSRAWTGGLYDESRRGWLNNLKDNEPARQAFRQGEWNHARIQAIGPSIKTWINGVPAADYIDDMTLNGFIALQVHGVGGRTEPVHIRWRNIRLWDLDPAKATELFNGRNLEGWTLANGQPAAQGWVAQDGTLFRKSSGGDIFTENQFADFVLDLDWKISPGGNSGVKYRVTRYGNALLGPEYQILDDDRHPDAKPREGRRQAAALYDVLACQDSKELHPVGEWNHARIIARGSHIEHWLNGNKVLAYDTSSESWERERQASKFSSHPNFAQNDKGQIMLQDHGDEVWYRNILLRPLP